MARYILLYVHPDLGEQRFELRRGMSYRLGSRDSADIVIPQKDVSRNHAVITVREHSFHITDLDSKNGTFVNGNRVSSCEFRCGDEIRLSSARLTIIEVSSGTFALAPEIQPTGRVEARTGESEETHQYHKEPGIEDMVVLLEDLAASIRSGGVGELLSRVVDRFAFRGIVLLYRDASGDVAVVASAGDTGGIFGEAGNLGTLLGEEGGEGGGWDRRVRQVSVEQNECLVGRLGEGHSLAVVAGDGVPAVVDLRAIMAAVEVAISVDRGQVGASHREPEGPPGAEDPMAAILGVSAPIQECKKLACEYARLEEPVMITGESGTGKELFARAIHAMSPRGAGPFVAVNCAAIPPDLMEAELFGVAPGAATGVSERPGRFQAAEGGTLFLDEIGELPPSLQAKLLRVLEEGELYRVGDDVPVVCDVRVISATNRSIRTDVKDGRFRADLFYRLHVFHIHVPPLRERRRDIPVLVNEFLDRAARRMGRHVNGVTVQALEVLMAYPWPGNVRELRSELTRAVAAVTPGAVVDVAHLSRELSAGEIAEGGVELGELAGLPLSEAREAVERLLIRRALETCGGNQTRAAKQLGLSRAGLYKKLQKLGLS